MSIRVGLRHMGRVVPSPPWIVKSEQKSELASPVYDGSVLTEWFDLANSLISINAPEDGILLILFESGIYGYVDSRGHVTINVDGDDQNDSGGSTCVNSEQYQHLKGHWVKAVTKGSHDVKIRCSVRTITGGTGGKIEFSGWTLTVLWMKGS